MSDKSFLTHIDNAKREIMLADDIVKIKDWANQAEAIRQYQKAAGDVELVNRAMELKLRCERRIGELLIEMKERGEIHKGGQFSPSTSNRGVTSTLSDLNIDRRTSSRSQKIASIPEDKFEAVLAEHKEQEKELTRGTLESLIREDIRQGKIDDLIVQSSSIESIEKKYSVIYADPPWRYDFSRSPTRDIENQYPTMDIKEILNLPIQLLRTDDSILFLWATSPKLPEAFLVLESWGFKYKTCAIWNKGKIGMGYYFRQQHELLLVATTGNIPPPKASDRVSSIIESVRARHSEKPEIVYEIIENMYPELNKIELFSRHKRDNWDSWGYEA